MRKPIEDMTIDELRSEVALLRAALDHGAYPVGYHEFRMNYDPHRIMQTVEPPFWAQPRTTCSSAWGSP